MTNNDEHDNINLTQEDIDRNITCICIGDMK